MWQLNKPLSLPDAQEALAGRVEPMPISDVHIITGNPIVPPFPEGCEQVLFGMGCFWGAERLFWQQPGIYCTAVGYAGGITTNPNYKEVCSGLTGHSEVVLVVYHPQQTSFTHLLKLFWESHDPTQGMRQGNDIGTQYRSCLFTYSNQQHQTALDSRDRYQTQITAAKGPKITTEIAIASHFYYAESDHQQYLAKHPDGYCGLRGTGIEFPGCEPSQTGGER